tara:strand:+ start:591 stop:1436 length:846 start_codon:yes stop_codon:yes gene_type:complete
MKVTIVGHGFVGKAIENGLNNNVQTLIIDPIYKKEISEIISFNPEVIFISVPTPMRKDGDQDLTILKKVIEEIVSIGTNAEVVIKSTVLPNNISIIEKMIPSIVYNPEFLTEKNAFEDFINADLNVFGGNEKNVSKIVSFYKNNTKCLLNDYIVTDLVSASLIKYTINTFLASKVIFFNELQKLFNKSGTTETWENFIKAISLDSRIGKSHMKVPGPDGRYGFGGACFPKDSQALYQYSLSQEEPLHMLKKVIDLNNKIRSSYDSINDREIDQNITFSTKE